MEKSGLMILAMTLHPTTRFLSQELFTLRKVFFFCLKNSKDYYGLAYSKSALLRWHAFPSLKEIVKGAYVLPSLATAVLGDYFQFERLGHFEHGLDPREAYVQHDCCGRAQAVTIGRRSRGCHCLSLSLSHRVLPS